MLNSPLPALTSGMSIFSCRVCRAYISKRHFVRFSRLNFNCAPVISWCPFSKNSIIGAEAKVPIKCQSNVISSNAIAATAVKKYRGNFRPSQKEEDTPQSAANGNLKPSPGWTIVFRANLNITVPGIAKMIPKKAQPAKNQFGIWYWYAYEIH